MLFTVKVKLRLFTLVQRRFVSVIRIITVVEPFTLSMNMHQLNTGSEQL